MHRSTLYDLDEMLLQCKTVEARELIDEAYLAYKAGAYRSSIVATWQAVYFDLVAKIKSLSLSGNESASTWIEKYRRLISDYQPDRHNTAVPLQQIESEILNFAVRDKIELISRMELHDLKRLKSDRNRCAHPTMLNETERFAPPAELARLHLRNAMQHVLTRPPIRGMKAVKQILMLIEDSGFPIDEADSKVVLQELGVGDLDEASLQALIAQLITILLHSESKSQSRVLVRYI